MINIEQFFDTLTKGFGTGFGTGLALGDLMAYLARALFDKYLELKFSKNNLKHQKSVERYEELYCPLVRKILGITIEANRKTSTKTILRHILIGIKKRNFSSVSHILKMNKLVKKPEYYLSGYSQLDFKGMQKHIGKYHHLADPELLELLGRAIRSENENSYIKYLNQSYKSSKSYDDGEISMEFYKLINHIDKYSQKLNKELFY